MLWHFLIEATHGTWSTFIAILFDTLLELFYRRRGSTFNIFIIQPTQCPLCSYLVNMGSTACGGKADSISMPHSSTNMKVWGVTLWPWNTKINWGLRNTPWADGWSVGSRYSHNLPGLRFQESPADDKNDFSSLLYVLEFMVRNITAFYSGCWYIATQSVLPLHL